MTPEEVLSSVQVSLTSALCAVKDSPAAELVPSLRHIKSIKHKSFFCTYQIVPHPLFFKSQMTLRDYTTKSFDAQTYTLISPLCFEHIAPEMSQEQCAREASYSAFSKSILRYRRKIGLREKEVDTPTLFSWSLLSVGWKLEKTSFDIIGSQSLSREAVRWNEGLEPAALGAAAAG